MFDLLTSVNSKMKRNGETHGVEYKKRKSGVGYILAKNF